MDIDKDYIFEKNITNIKNTERIIFCLPLTINQNSNLMLRINQIIKKNFKKFMLSHISQISYFKNTITELYAHYSIITTNSFCALFLSKLGFVGFTKSIEDDHINFLGIKSELKKFVFINYYPALFTTRIINPLLNDNFYNNDIFYRIDKLNNLYKITTANKIILNNPIFEEFNTTRN